MIYFNHSLLSSLMERGERGTCSNNDSKKENSFMCVVKAILQEKRRGNIDFI